MIKKFIKDEGITLKNLFNPVFMFKLLYKHKYIHFFVTGISGVLINLLLTWLFTEYVFGGDEYYFYGFMVGTAVNLIYNFILHSIITFRTKEKHTKRFLWFIIYSLTMTAIQATIVKTITNIIGTEYYLFVICGVIFSLSSITFLVFKLKLFKNDFRSN